MRTVAAGTAQPRPKRVGLQTFAHAMLLTAGLMLAYFSLPLDRPFTARTLMVLVLGLALVAVLLGWQVRLIARSPNPRLQALKAFAMTVPLFLLLFATTYYLLERSTPGSFSQALSRSDALYFTMTVFSTVGFGDIVARSEVARDVVTGQMAANLLLLGAAARLVLDAVRAGTQRLALTDDRVDRSPRD